MFNFIKRFQAKQKEQVESVREKYKRLAFKAAKSGDLTDAETGELSNIAGVLGIPMEGEAYPLDGTEPKARSVAGDVLAVQAYLEVQRIAGNLEAAVSDLAAVANAVEEHDAETNRRIAAIRSERASEGARLGADRDQKQSVMRETRKAKAKADLIEKTAWAVLGGVDPAIAAAERLENKKRVYLRWGTEADYPLGDGVRVVHHFAGGILLPNMGGKTFEKSESQDDAEFAAMVDAAKRFDRGAMYLRRRSANLPKIAGLRGENVMYFEDFKNHPPHDPTGKYTAYPGVSGAEFGEMCEAIHDHYRKGGLTGKQAQAQVAGA